MNDGVIAISEEFYSIKGDVEIVCGCEGDFGGRLEPFKCLREGGMN
jgi:hypothetical protein